MVKSGPAAVLVIAAKLRTMMKSRPSIFISLVALAGLLLSNAPQLWFDLSMPNGRPEEEIFDHRGQGIGFFQSYADSFWKSTQMELDLVHQDGEKWSTIAGRIRSSQCRNLALDKEAKADCERCFWEACERAVLKPGFQNSNCHAGRRFSVCSLGDCGGRKMLLLAGRVVVEAQESKEPGKRSVSHGRTPPKTFEEYRAAIQLIELSLPYLISRLKIESFAVDRGLSPIVRRACRYIDRHYRDNLSLARVAGACRVSEDHLCHLFSQQTGRTLTRYINSVRIGHAMYLLGKSEMNITEICYDVGYQSMSQFNRTFRSMKGMPPSHYRKNLSV